MKKRIKREAYSLMKVLKVLLSLLFLDTGSFGICIAGII